MAAARKGIRKLIAGKSATSPHLVGEEGVTG